MEVKGPLVELGKRLSLFQSTKRSQVSAPSVGHRFLTKLMLAWSRASHESWASCPLQRLNWRGWDCPVLSEGMLLSFSGPLGNCGKSFWFVALSYIPFSPSAAMG